jgi:hypothetical protein
MQPRTGLGGARAQIRGVRPDQAAILEVRAVGLGGVEEVEDGLGELQGARWVSMM